jgi:hypothetical protein
MAQPTDLEIPPSPAQNAPRAETHAPAPAHHAIAFFADPTPAQF